MKIQYVLALGFLAALSPAHAGFSIVDSNYSASTYFTHSNSDSIVSFAKADDGNIYYTTATGSGNFGGLYSTGSGTAIVSGTSDFSGNSVTSNGANVYYNITDICKYGSLSGSPTNSTASSHANYSLSVYSGGLFVTGSGPSFEPNAIYYSSISGDGSLGSFVNLGLTGAGYSGPLTFDSAGNLYYAAGFNDLSIYKWSAAEVASAIAGTPLSDVSGHLWVNYGSTYGTVSGGSSMVVVGDQLVISLTSFSDPSLLVSFGISGTGTYNSVTDVIGEDTGRLGDVRYQDGVLLVGSGNQIVQVVPEPQTWLMFGAGLGVIVLSIYRRRRA